MGTGPYRGGQICESALSFVDGQAKLEPRFIASSRSFWIVASEKESHLRFTCAGKLALEGGSCSFRKDSTSISCPDPACRN